MTWGEDLKAYEQGKKQLQFEQPPKPKFISNQEKKAKEREYDPVLQHYRDGGKEDQLKTVEHGKQEVAMRRAWANTVQREAPYNLINNTDKRKTKTPEKRPDKPKPPGKESRINYNVITNERLPDRPASPEKGESNIVREAHREYNILSNHYWKGNDERVQKENAAERKALKERYWKTHDLDVLTQVYHDPEKEAATRAREEVRHELNAIRQASGFPPAVALSEGQCYDITSGVVLDPDKHEYRTGKANAAARRKAVGPKFEEMNRKRNEEEDVKKMARLIERNSYARFAETEKRGYDVLSNIPYKGLDGKPPVKPRMAEPKTLKDFVADPSNLGPPAVTKKLQVADDSYADKYAVNQNAGGQPENDNDFQYIDGEDVLEEAGSETGGGGPESIPPVPVSRGSSRGSSRARTADSQGSVHSSARSHASTQRSQRSALSTRGSDAVVTSSSRASTARSTGARSTTSSARAGTAASHVSSRVSLATPTSADLARSPRAATAASSRPPKTAPSSRATTARSTSSTSRVKTAGSAAASSRAQTAESRASVSQASSRVSTAGTGKSSAASAASEALKSRASSRRSATSSRAQSALSVRIASSRASSRASAIKA